MKKKKIINGSISNDALWVVLNIMIIPVEIINLGR